MNKTKFRKITAYLLLAVSFLMLLTGYGITNYQLFNKLTLGFFQKSTAFQLHSKIAILFIALLLVHVFLTSALARRK